MWLLWLASAHTLLGMRCAHPDEVDTLSADAGYMPEGNVDFCARHGIDSRDQPPCHQHPEGFRVAVAA
jgi:hypothetical protein